MTLLLLSLMLIPVAAGLVATVLPAFGVLPAIGGVAVSLDPWRALLGWPGLPRALALTMATGFAATCLAFVLAVALAVLARRRAMLRVMGALLPPMLATPHVALAIGFSFVIAPSGWLVRLVSPWLTGWHSPPDWATVQDPKGIALTLGLVLKETPYLLLVLLAALAQGRAVALRRVAAALGYGPWRAWMLVVLPSVWPQIRLPVIAVLAYALSVVDVALVLGPDDPPTLAVQILRWFSDPDIARWFPAAAAAVLLLAIVLVAIAALEAAAALLGLLARRIARGGGRGGAGFVGDGLTVAAGAGLAGAGGGGLLGLAVWSLAGAWRFPEALPRSWTFSTWSGQSAALATPAWTTLCLAASATAIALLLVVGALERERLHGPAGRLATLLLYAPLVVPQIAFLFGMQVALVRLGMDGGALAVLWAHLVFVLPYVFLALADPWRALDPRLSRTASCLGASPARVLWRVTLPLLLRPLLAAAASGFAVSAGLYLPTLFAGAGRWATLTTEAVTLSAGADRRIVAATAFLQAALPLVVYAAALAVPALRERRRAGLAIVG
jgi:putative thiamine transport system permease protein